MQPDRVWTVRRTCGKRAYQRILRIASRMHLENRALRFVQPGENPDVLARLDAGEALAEFRKNFEFGIRRAFRSLMRSGGTVLHGGAYETNDGDFEWEASHKSAFPFDNNTLVI